MQEDAIRITTYAVSSLSKPAAIVQYWATTTHENSVTGIVLDDI